MNAPRLPQADVRLSEVAAAMAGFRILKLGDAWNRTRLSRELCLVWNWRNNAGRLKDMACRTLLLKLEARGQIRLIRRNLFPAQGHSAG